MLPLAAALILAAAPAAEDPAADQARVGHARALFESWVEHAASFDPKILDLYDPAARIEVTARGPEDAEVLKFSVAQLRETIGAAMAQARRARDYDTFRDVTFALEGSNVRIRGTKSCPVRKQDNPFSLLVGPDASGRWKILAETGEHQVGGSATAKMVEEMKRNPDRVKSVPLAP